MIYADNAATTQLDPDALDAMMPYLTECYGNPSQPYSFSRKQRKALQEAREIIADCIGATADEIYFTSGGTESDNWVIKNSLEYRNKYSIITSSFEHHAILKACEDIAKFGVPINYIKPNKEGFITLQALESLITETTKLVSIMMVNNEIGTIQPIKELATISHKYGALFHTDAVQAVGHIMIDVKDMDADFLSASAHKFNGPRGTGFLYIKKGIKINPFMSGGAQEYGMRAGTENVAAIVGMSVALKNNNKMIAEVQNNTAICSTYLKKLLIDAGIDCVFNGGEPKISSNINVSFKDISGEMLLHRLDLMGILVSTGSACDGSKTQISHVIKEIGVPKNYASGTIRISLGKNVSIEEVEKIANAIKKIILK